MATEVRPLGTKCNIGCTYCYQEPVRAAGNAQGKHYDLEAIKEAVLREGGPFTVFGGEPLLVPLEDLNELWAWGYERFGRNSIQTNGTLITPEHIESFRRYKVGVGISIDGPGELNDLRWHLTLERTRTSTERSHAAIDQLCQAGMPPSLIITLHQANATEESLPELEAWIRSVHRKGVKWVRIHLLESESAEIRDRYALSPEENIAALRRLRQLARTLPNIRMDLFDDMRRMLLGRDNETTCIWNGCDPYTTRAVRGVEGDGQRSNCGRTNKEGVDFVKADDAGFERYIALYHTEQSSGGCRGCRFFLMCKGNCPGTAIDGDWRNRTEHCDVWKALYADLESEMVVQGADPISLSSRRTDLEAAMLAAWAEGQSTSMAVVLQSWRRKDSEAPPGRLRAEFEQIRADFNAVG